MLSLLYPRWYMVCLVTLMLDILSHWMHMYATLVTGSDTHKVRHNPALAELSLISYVDVADLGMGMHAPAIPSEAADRGSGAGRAQPKLYCERVLQVQGVHGILLYMLRGPVPRTVHAALAARPVMAMYAQIHSCSPAGDVCVWCAASLLQMSQTDTNHCYVQGKITGDCCLPRPLWGQLCQAGPSNRASMLPSSALLLPSWWSMTLRRVKQRLQSTLDNVDAAQEAFAWGPVTIAMLYAGMHTE